MVKVVFLGTGDAFNSGGRFFTSVRVDGSSRVLLDCSPQVVYALEKLGYPVNTISHIAITHAHGDHAGGLPFILLNLEHKTEGRVTIIGPDGIDRFVEAAYKLFFRGGDAGKVFRVQPPDSELPFTLRYMEGVHPVKSYIYRLEIDDRVIVYTGDTSKVDLSRFARDADILIHEATSLDPRSGEYGHSTPFEAAEAAAAANVRQLAIVHTSPIPLGVRRKVRAIFANTVFPKDLQVIKI